ncbi:MAG TPA: hypothetical protein VM513_15270 [Kofleriaceae bacterium]|jgi:hypothetical protein|nr:hypothetical protein [Kofleriaceae bacterium]
MRRLVLLALTGCADHASAERGLDALLQVEGAQFRPGVFPADEGGPAATALSTRHSSILTGRLDEELRGVLAPEAHAAVIGIEGAPGAWIVPAGVADFDTPGQPTARAVFGVADDFPPGPFTLVLAASDADGRFGAPATTQLVADVEPPPAGTLVIGLVWDGAADLDLHVVDPLGGEAWSDKPNTLPPPVPGEPVDPEEYSRHGILDHDGNKDCRRDGRPNEHVIWTVPPPAGEYVVRVDARSLCGDASAAWYVAAYRDGELVAAARGLSTPEDVLHPHGAGAGVLALRFTQ